MEIPEALTFDDVLLEPRHSSVLPKETIVSTQLSSAVTHAIRIGNNYLTQSLRSPCGCNSLL